MSLISFLKKTINDFRGAWLLHDQVQQNASRASLCQNMRFLPSKVFTRAGFAQAFALGTGSIRTFYNQVTIYLGTEYSRLVYLEGANSVKLYYIGGGTIGPNPSALFTQACAGLSFVEAETRLYIAQFTDNGAAASTLKILSTLLSGVPVDVAFPSPPTGVTITVTDGGAGTVSAGDHKFCIRVVSRTGFPGVPTGITTATVAPGGRKLNISVATDAMTDSAVIQLCMTTADNLEKFWDIPGMSAAYLPGQTSYGGFEVDITDDELVALPDTSDVTDNFNIIHGGLNVSVGCAFGNRNAYVVGNKVYITNPYNLQWLIESDNAIQVEGQKHIVTIAPIGASLVLYGPDYTFVLGGDNNRIPRQWAPPERVSKALGTQCVGGVEASSGHQFHWVAHQSGLYVFNGEYGEIPVSYMFDRDWQRINWDAARAKLQMVDDTKRLYISVPLDGATECNYRMVIDYSRARSGGTVDPTAVDYTLDDYNSAGQVPSIGLVQDFTTKKLEFCMGLSDGNMIREDSTARTDKTNPIHSVYETGLNLASSETPHMLTKFGGMQAQLSGSGQLAITPYGLGRQISSDDPVDSISLQEDPDGEEEARWHMASENQSIRMETGQSAEEAGAWFELSRLKVYYKPSGSTKAS